MIETIYTELPFEKIHYLDRPEFHKKEKKFKLALTESMKKYGIKDPIYCWANGKAYGDIIKVIVGNNRMAVAKELGIKEVPIIVNIWTPETFDLKGRELKTDEEIRSLFKLKEVSKSISTSWSRTFNFRIEELISLILQSKIFI